MGEALPAAGHYNHDAGSFRRAVPNWQSKDIAAPVPAAAPYSAFFRV
jgi:hypothetical protein